MDGDKMGEFISDVQTKDEQRKKSRLLGQLSQEMPKIIENWGQTIYSGGDDLLATGSLENSIKTIFELKKRFYKEFKDYHEKFEKLKDYNVTSSAGIVITHYHNPLMKALQMVRENMERAKEEYSRNSLVITVWLSSQTIFSAGYKWDGFEDLFEEFFSCVKTKGLSSAFIYDILSETDALYDERKFEEKMFLSEVERLFKRHLKNKEKFDEDTEKLLKRLSFLAEPNPDFKKSVDIKENFINVLRICAFISRQKMEGI
jgi:CRISPR-associated protein Cmr2